MSRKSEQRIADIIFCCEKIIRFTAGMNRDQLIEREIVMDAVLRNIEIIGEAAKNIDDEVRSRYPGI